MADHTEDLGTLAHDYRRHAQAYAQALETVQREGPALGYDIAIHRDSAVLTKLREDIEALGGETHAKCVLDSHKNVIVSWD